MNECRQRLKTLEQTHTPQGLQDWQAAHAVATLIDTIGGIHGLSDALKADRLSAEKQLSPQDCKEIPDLLKGLRSQFDQACTRCIDAFKDCPSTVKGEVQGIVQRDMPAIFEDSVKECLECMPQAGADYTP